MTETRTPDSIPYASPAIRPPSRVAPAVWIAIVGLGLIFFGGCFLIGILLTLRNGFIAGSNPPPMTGGIVLFLIVLYASALGCFGGALLLVVKGVRALFAMV